MGVRRIDYEPRLDLAIRAAGALKPRQKLRPYVMIHRKRKTTVTARHDLDRVNSSSYGRQTAYTLDGSPGVIAIATMTGSIGGGGGGGSGGDGRGGGGWPR